MTYLHNPRTFETKFRLADNQLIINNLFYEKAQGNLDKAIYTLARTDIEEDGKTYQSLYRLYMELGDLTEFKFAETYFESFQHWKKICSRPWMHPHLGEWREELELKIRANALASLIDRSTSSTEIAKYLLNNNWVDKMHDSNQTVNLRGRPSKQEIKNNLTVITNNRLQEQSDYERIKHL